MTETTKAISSLMQAGRAEPPASTKPSRVARVAAPALQDKGITSVIDHRDPGFFRTRMITLFPPLAELHEAGAFPYPDLDSLLEAHLKNRWGEDVWNGFSPEKQLKYKRGLAGSARNWDDLIYQVVLENLDKIPGLTPDQRKRLKQPPLIREEFCHNSPLNGKSYLDADGNRIDLTHAGSCSEDRESENIHLFRRIGYADSRETLYYTGRPETREKAIEQGSWIFLKELQATGKGITRNADGTYTLNYVVDSLIDSLVFAESDKAEHVRAKLRQEIATLRAMRNEGPLEITGPDGTVYRVNLRPILLHQQYNIFSTGEKFVPVWMSGKSFSDDIVAEGLPHLQALAQEVRQKLQDQFPKTSLNTQKDLLKRIGYLDLAMGKIENYGSLTRRERAFYFALLCRMLEVPLVVHCKSSKDRTGGIGKLICALYTWLDAGMPDDFSKIIGKESGKDSPLRKLFDELIVGNLMVANQVTGYGLGATGVVDGEQLDAERRGLDIGEAPPIVDRLPERYTKAWHPAAIALWSLVAAPILWGAAVTVELAAIGAMVLEVLLTLLAILTGILPAIYFLSSDANKEKIKKNIFYITRNVGPTIPQDLFIRPFYIFKLCFKRKLDKDAPYIKERGFAKSSGRKIEMAEANKAILRQIEAIPQATYDNMLAYLRQPNPQLAADTPHRDELVALGRDMPTLSRIAKRPDFSLTPKARTLIEAFEASKKTVRDEIEYLPETEFDHLCAFLKSENRDLRAVLSPREKVIYEKLICAHGVLEKEQTTDREKILAQLVAGIPTEQSFSLDHIERLEQAKYDRLIEHFTSPHPQLADLTPQEQLFLGYILTGANELFARALKVAALTEKQLRFLQTLAETPYGTFTLARGDFFSKTPGELPKETLIALIRDIDTIHYEARNYTLKAGHFLEAATPFIIRDLIEGWIDEIPEAEYQQILQALAQAEPTPDLFPAQHKQLLLAIANHIQLLTPPFANERHRALIDACKASHLLVFQLHNLMSLEKVNATVSKTSAVDTLSDLSYCSPQNDPIESLDGVRTFMLGEEVRRDLARVINLQFYRGDDYQPFHNPAHDDFTLSAEFLATPIGVQFLARLQEELEAKGVGALYLPLAAAVQTMPLNALSCLLHDKDHLEQLRLKGLNDFAAALEIAYHTITAVQLFAILKNLQERLLIDVLFENLSALPAFQDMEQPPPPAQECVAQTGRNSVQHLRQLHFYAGVANHPVMLMPFPGDDWRIGFRSADAASFSAHYEGDFILRAPTNENANLGKIHFYYEHRFHKPDGSEIWESQFHVPAAPKITFSPALAQDTDLLFSSFTCPAAEQILPPAQMIGLLQGSRSGKTGLFYKLSPDLRAYYQRRRQENLALLQPLMEPVEYQAYVASLPQKEAEKIKKDIRQLEADMPAMTLEQLAACEATLNAWLPRLQELIPDPEFQQISAQARAIVAQRRAALAPAAV